LGRHVPVLLEGTTSMTPLRQRMIDDMVAAGLVANTQAAYIQAVRRLAKHYMRSPEDLSETEVRSYLLHLRDDRAVAHGTFLPAHAAIQFLYVRTLDRDWALFSKKSPGAQAQAVARSSIRRRGSRDRRRCEAADSAYQLSLDVRLRPAHLGSSHA
jgi:hypothetical protein